MDSGETVPAPPSLLSVKETKPCVDRVSLRASLLSFKVLGFVFWAKIFIMSLLVKLPIRAFLMGGGGFYPNSQNKINAINKKIKIEKVKLKKKTRNVPL